MKKLSKIASMLALIGMVGLGLNTHAQVTTPHTSTVIEQARQIVYKSLPYVVTINTVKTVPEQSQIIYGSPFQNDPQLIELLRQLGIEIRVGAPTAYSTTAAQQIVGAGSGFIVSHSGYIVTNKHVVADSEASFSVVLSDGTRKDARVVYRDPVNDIAVVKIEGYFPIIATLGDSSQLTSGEAVAAIGNMYGRRMNSSVLGHVAGFNQSITAAGEGYIANLNGLIATNAPIVEGYSGGPLVNLQGNVVGINVARDTVQGGLSFAIPINTVKKAVSAYLNS
jgi:S1-C subfamily serine protease